MIRCDLRCCCSLGIIFLICSLSYKLLEYDIIRIETKETINLENGNLESSDNTQKFNQNRHVTKSKRYNNLRKAFIKKFTFVNFWFNPHPLFCQAQVQVPLFFKAFTSDLKKAANYAIQNCLCSSKQRSSWFDKVIFIIICM